MNNLVSIIDQGVLLSDNLVASREVTTIHIGNLEIKDKRSHKPVPAGSGGVIADYVPFYFAPRSPMLYRINSGDVSGYTGGQRPIVHLESSIERVAEQEIPFVFTNLNAAIYYASFFDNLVDLNRVDWNVMESRIWRNTPSDPDRMARRMAEFLVHRALPWAEIERIGVIDQRMANTVTILLQFAAHRPEVAIRPDWYYS